MEAICESGFEDSGDSGVMDADAYLAGFGERLDCHLTQDEWAAALGEGLGLLENWLGCTLPESQQEGGLSVGAVGPQGASRWRDYPRRRVRARSFAP